MYELLKSRNEYLEKDVINFTKELINIKSYSLNEESCAKICLNKMNTLGYDKTFNDKSGNIIGIIYGKKYSPTVLLISHLDTVNVYNKSIWKTNPFKAVKKGSKIYGVGASDCKSGLASQIYTGALLKNSLLPLEGNMIVAAVVAEENGLSVGVKSLLNNTLPEINMKPDYVILGEPTNLNINYGHDGWIQYDIIIEGENRNDVEQTANKIYFNYSQMISNKNNHNYYNSSISKINITNNQQGKNYITLNYLSRVKENYDEIGNLMVLNQNCNSLKSQLDVGVKVKIHDEKQKLYTGFNTIVKYKANAWETNPFSKLVERAGHALDAAGLRYEKTKWKLKKLGMGTSGNVITNDFNIPTIGYGPGNEELAHEANEFVEVQNIIDCVYGTTSIVHSLIGIPVFGWTSDEI